MTKRLNTRQAKFVTELVTDPKGNATAAAQRAGYSKKSAKYQASRLIKDPRIAAEIEAVRGAVREIAKYDANVALAELQDCIVHAIETGNSTARVRATELRAKLAGLLTERVDVKVEHYDIGGALAAARRRSVVEGSFEVLSDSTEALPASATEPSIFD